MPSPREPRLQRMPVIALLALLSLLFAVPVAAQRIFRDGFEESKPGLGTNLEGVEDFAAAYPFTDFFKQSRPWITSAPNGCTPPSIVGASCFDTLQADQLDLDADGWVRSLPPCPPTPTSFCFARTVINSAQAPYPAGRYLVLYDGAGTLTYSGATRIVADSSPGRDVVQVAGNSVWIITLEATDPQGTGNYVRNIRVLPPGFDPAVAAVPMFHPDFLARLAPYRSLRFMDWMRTNGNGFGGQPNTQQDFPDRPQVTDAHWTREAGVPLEAMIDLANVSGTEPWFTLPHRASNAYMQAFATLVRDRLAPGRKVYVEYSNEVWNSAFPQGAEIEQRGGMLYGALGDAFIRRLNAHGQRSAELCVVWKQVFSANPDRVVCVLGAQAANAFTQTEAADCPLAVQVGQRTTPCSADLDVVAIAPYFGNYLDVPNNANEVQLWSLNHLFSELQDGGQLQDVDADTPCTEANPPVATRPCPIAALEEVLPWITAHVAAANPRELRVYAYEGGQHLVGVFGVENNQAITDLFLAANRDARMGAAYAAYLASWRAGGGELFMHFTLSNAYGKFGSWGSLEALIQSPLPPKAQAIETFNAVNPCWWSGCNE